MAAQPVGYWVWEAEGSRFKSWSGQQSKVVPGNLQSATKVPLSKVPNPPNWSHRTLEELANPPAVPPAHMQDRHPKRDKAVKENKKKFLHDSASYTHGNWEDTRGATVMWKTAKLIPAVLRMCQNVSRTIKCRKLPETLVSRIQHVCC